MIVVTKQNKKFVLFPFDQNLILPLPVKERGKFNNKLKPAKR